MKRLGIIIFVALCSAVGWAQSAPISGFVVNQYGNPVAGAQVYICSAAGSSGLPCSPVASIYQDYNLTIPAANPTQTDANGDFGVYVGVLSFPNVYVVNAVPQSGTTYTWLYPGPTTLASLGGAPYPSGTGIPNVTGGATWGSTYNASNKIPANFLTAYTTISQAGTPLAQEPVLNFLANVTCTDTPGVSTNCTPSGGGGTPGGLTTQVQVNVAGAFGGYSTLTYAPSQGLVVGVTPTGNIFSMNALSTQVAWTFNYATPETALSSMYGAPLNGVGTSGNWPINAATATLAATATKANALASIPVTCASGSAPTGINVYGNAVGCTAYANSVSACSTYASTSTAGCALEADGKWFEWVVGSPIAGTAANTTAARSEYCTWPVAFPHAVFEASVSTQEANVTVSSNGMFKSYGTATTTSMSVVLQILGAFSDDGTLMYPVCTAVGY